MGRYEEALEDANQALKLLSTGPSGLRSGEGEMCHKRSGLAAFQLQKYSEATEALKKAAQLASLNGRPDASYLEWVRQCDEKLNPPAEQKQPAKTEPSPSTPAAASTMEKSSTPAAPKEAAPQPATTTAVAAPTRAATTNKRPTMPKYQYYQSDKVMTIAILEASVKEEDLSVNFEPKWLTVILRKGGVDFTVIAGALYGEIDVEKSKVVIKDEKVLIKLRKIDAHEWHELFGKAEDSKPKSKKTETAPKASDAAKASPYASHRDWDAIEKNLKEEEKNVKPEGDEAMNKLFQQIYGNASEETRRAMVKSYQTSGGTVLSTNWDEVSKKDYEKERTAPKGMEWKNWEGDKLQMKDDD
jgi:suppressor of G2 allele of SKP1